jgi:hypothetical protein
MHALSAEDAAAGYSVLEERRFVPDKAPLDPFTTPLGVAVAYARREQIKWRRRLGVADNAPALIVLVRDPLRAPGGAWVSVHALLDAQTAPAALRDVTQFLRCPDHAFNDLSPAVGALFADDASDHVVNVVTSSYR